jgi:hypothetical protein
MHFNDTTHKISLAVLGITILYTLAYSGLTGLLLSSAVALIAAAFIDPLELVVALTVIFVLFYTFYLKKWLRTMEPFQDGATTIANRIGGMNKKILPVLPVRAAKKGPTGVLSAFTSEGFADVGSDGEKDGEPNHSKPASTKETYSNEVDPDHVKAVSSSMENKNDNIESDELKSATGTLFKKGQMPSEHADGPNLDAGKTIMKAMESFDSDTVSNMTGDTKKLLATQKQLMEMLTNMRPVLADGKELLQTFSGMFGGGNGGGSGMPFKLNL